MNELSSEHPSQTDVPNPEWQPEYLFSIANRLQRKDAVSPEALGALVQFMASDWPSVQPPHVRIILQGRTYQTDGFVLTSRGISAEILADGEPAGSIDVCLADGSPGTSSFVLASEKQRLLALIAARLGSLLEYEKIAQRAQEHEAELAHMSRLSTVGEMASSLAHEINQPLTAILNCADACLNFLKANPEPPARLYEPLQQIAQQADRAGEIIQQIRNFVRKRPSQHLPIDAGEMARQIVAIMQKDARQHGVTIELTIQDRGLIVRADKVEIQQVLVNLIRNSLDALETAPSSQRQLGVTVTRTTESMALVTVRDTGCGLPAGDAEQIFKPFFTTKAEGLGIGLSISRSIIEGHGGRLWAESQPGRGTTVSLTLPFAETGMDHDAGTDSICGG